MNDQLRKLEEEAFRKATALGLPPRKVVKNVDYLTGEKIMRLEWKKAEDSKREVYHNEETGWQIYKGVGDYWFVIPTGWPENHHQFGPYLSKEEAVGWSSRLQHLSQFLQESKKMVDSAAHLQ